MIALVGIAITAPAMAIMLFWLGFRTGGAQWQARLIQARLEAAKAERDLHELTRRSFVAMAEVAQKHDSSVGR